MPRIRTALRAALVALTSLGLLVSGAVIPAAGAVAAETTAVVVATITDVSGQYDLRQGGVVARNVESGEKSRAMLSSATDAVFTFWGLPPGSYELTYEPRYGTGYVDRLAYPGTDAEPGVIAVARGETRQVDWAVRYRPMSVRGTVTDSVTGEPLAGVHLILGTQTLLAATATSGEDGTYRIERLWPGVFTLLSARIVTHLEQSGQQLRVSDGENVLDIALDPFASISAHWTSPIPEGLWVEAHHGAESFVAKTDAQSSVHFSRLPAGDYTLRVRRDSTSSVAANWLPGVMSADDAQVVSVRPGEHASLEWVRRDGALIGGTAADPGGTPIDDVTVVLQDADTDEEIDRVVTQEDGRYSFGGLDDGTYQVTLDHQWAAYHSGRYELSVAERDADLRTTTLIPRSRITGTVIFPDGSRGAGSALIYDTSMHLVTSGRYSSTDPTFETSWLEPGEYLVRFEGPTGSIRPTWYGGTTVSAGATRVVVEEGSSARIEQALIKKYGDPRGFLKATVRDATGTPISAIRARLFDADGFLISERESGTDGTVDFFWYDTPPGDYRVQLADTRSPALFATTWFGGPSDPRDRSIHLGAGQNLDTPLVIPGALGTVITHVPTLPASARVGTPIRAGTSGWTPATTFTYQWRRNGSAIAGAVGASYLPVAADRGAKLTVTVTGTRAGYSPASATSAARVVSPGILTSPTPKITGTRTVGRTLTAVRGTWTAGTTFTYRWYANGKAIKGATKKTYRLTSRERGDRITVKVTGHKAGYTTIGKTSARTARISR